jgi:cyclic pyranopterin phosphate synthase
MLSALKTTNGTKPDITLTTNGVLLTVNRWSCAMPGLDRVTVSLDAMSDNNFQRMSDSDFLSGMYWPGFTMRWDLASGESKSTWSCAGAGMRIEVIAMVFYFLVPVALRC